MAEVTAENSRLRAQRNSCREKFEAIESESARLADKMQTLTAAADAESSRLEEEHGKIIAMRDANIDLLERTIAQLRRDLVAREKDKEDQVAQAKASAVDNYTMDIRTKLKLPLASHVRAVDDIVGMLVSDEEEDVVVDAEAAPPADAPAPEAKRREAGSDL